MNAQPEQVKLLSPQQATIMQHLVDGMVIKEIATQMNLAASTVRQHIRKAKKKLGAGTQDRAIALAVALGEVYVETEYMHYRYTLLPESTTITIMAPGKCTKCGKRPEDGVLHHRSAREFLCMKCVNL